MGLYSSFIFPRILNFVMATGQMTKARIATLEGVTGNVFEIGFGTGLNLPHYPEGVSKITTVDVNPAMNSLAAKQVAQSPIPVESLYLNGETLPMDDETYDSVVCTWTLCSIENVDKALQEVRRVLKPEGKFFFIEHGLADEPKVQRRQHRFTPIQKIIGDGCHLNRDMKELIQDQRFQFTKLDTFYMDKTPKMFGYMYQGVATKA